MTKQQDEALANALQRIESGQIDLGVNLLRAILREAGYPVPPFIVAAREREPRGSER
jgi:hypothetical protein